MKLTWEQSLKYERYHFEGGDEAYIRKERSIADVERVFHRASEHANYFWREFGKPLIDQIALSGGQAHCKITHKFSGDLPPWWLYEVHNTGIGLGVSFSWVPAPTNQINFELGQKYYESDQLFNVLSRRAYHIRCLFFRMLEKWCWQEENKPEREGDVVELNINDRLYIFIAEHNRHGVLHWGRRLDQSRYFRRVIT